MLSWILKGAKSSYLSRRTEKVAENPTIGRTSDFPDVRVKIVRNYLIFYEFDDKVLKVLSVWDGNRDDKMVRVR